MQLDYHGPEPAKPKEALPAVPPPRAFTQGVGTVFQLVGGTQFLLMMFVCCGSSLISKDAATHSDLTRIGWHLSSDSPGFPTYSAQNALTIGVALGELFGLAMAVVGLGLQAESRVAAPAAAFTTTMALTFWVIECIFFAQVMRAVSLSLVAGALSLISLVLLVLSIGAMKEMWRNPPPPNMDVLPADYQVPYSHYHKDPPEVRLAAELDQRRRKLAVQQKELEMLEEKLRRATNPNQEKS